MRVNTPPIAMNKPSGAIPLARTLVTSSAVSLTVGTAACVAGAVRWDRRTPFSFNHAGRNSYETVQTRYRSDVSLAFLLAAINLLAVVWPAVCLVDKWRHGERAKARVWTGYCDNVVKRGVNPYRWLEFSLSVPLTVLVCAICLGANDFLFLLSQMVLAAAVVIVAYGQEREKITSDRDSRFPWFPISSAIGLFVCQWTLIFWNAHEAKAFVEETSAFGYGPTVCYLVGAGAIVYIMGCTSTFATTAFGSVFKPVKNCDAEIWHQSISYAVRVLVSLFVIPLFNLL
jgi:hypothetical protein